MGAKYISSGARDIRLSTFSRGNSKSAGLANDYIVRQNWMQYSASHVSTTALYPQTASEAISENVILIKFMVDHAPVDPRLACLCMHAYIQITHPCNSLLKMLDTGLHITTSHIIPTLYTCHVSCSIT